MSLFGNTEQHEITLPIGYDAAFDLAIWAAKTTGKITDHNKKLGLISFKQKMNLLKMRNTVTFTLNIVNQGEHITIIHINCNSGDGVIGFNSSARSYQEFINALLILGRR